MKTWTDDNKRQGRDGDVFRDKTGWPAGMLQDDSRPFSKWLSSRPNAKQEAREAAQAIADTSSPITEPGALPEHEQLDVPSGGGIVLAVTLVLASWACAVLLSVMVAP